VEFVGLAEDLAFAVCLISNRMNMPAAKLIQRQRILFVFLAV